MQTWFVHGIVVVVQTAETEGHDPRRTSLRIRDTIKSTEDRCCDDLSMVCNPFRIACRWDTWGLRHLVLIVGYRWLEQVQANW